MSYYVNGPISHIEFGQNIKSVSIETSYGSAYVTVTLNDGTVRKFEVEAEKEYGYYDEVTINMELFEVNVS